MIGKFFSEKKILITGACGGLGAQITHILSSVGAKLVVTSRSKKKLDELISRLPNNSEIIPIISDISNPQDTERLADEALASMGYLDALFNVAGIGYFSTVEEAREERIRHIFEVNAFSPILLTKKIVPSMKLRGKGRIINIVTSTGRVPIPATGIYGSSKSALAIMTNTMRLELSKSGIQIINIYPPTLDNSFEHNAFREKERSGLCPKDNCGISQNDVAEKIIEASVGSAKEVWLDKEGKWMALGALLWPKLIDRMMDPVKERMEARAMEIKPKEHRQWKLVQVESTIACNLNCIMCPWKDIRSDLPTNGHMSEEVWESIVPYLNDIQSIDFTGGGEPLLQKNLFEWIVQAKSAGCEAGFLTSGRLLTQKKIDKILETGLDWIGISIDGADKNTYEKIRKGSDFDLIRDRISRLSSMRIGGKPHIRINFVIMKDNFYQMESIVKLASELKADQVNFKQCDVIRGESGKGFGFFDSQETKEIKRLQKSLSRARRLARKLKIETTSFSFTPEEQSVCDQDPRNSLFVKHDGQVSPCINLALGGDTLFLGKEVKMPFVSYGKLPEMNLNEIMNTPTCKIYKKKFENRVKIHNAVIAKRDIGHSLIKLNEAFQKAIEAMPDPPPGCEVCHYLYDI